MRLKYLLMVFSLYGFIILPAAGFSQSTQNKKYQGLLWEISGNGLKKPSYLFGTMHVSSKMVFHLADSFYYALQNVNVVAIELNPEVWQVEMVKLDQLQKNFKNFSQGAANDYLNEKSFKIDSYEDELKAALQSEPTIVNGLLYRTYKAKEDFEEDTFLDLYIYQTAKRLGKITTGVEDYFATEKTVLEAYADMAKEKKKNYDSGNDSPYEIEKKVEDAYRRGDLDLLDSLEIIMLGSEAFRNKFLLKRNEIQANSIDTILKKNSLFVGVGAAHLPGEKGVIELLRQKGYRLRPVKLVYKNTFQQSEIDKQKVPVNFSQQTSGDSLFSVDVPGKLYKMSTDYSGLDRSQYADMSNGAYYLATRVKTYSAFSGNTEQSVYNKVDSLLYENIPGKIIKKTAIKRNGYNGIDIINKTRRGDIQRYQIFVTQHEVLVFKMSAKETYANGAEAEKYFSSIRIKSPENGWVNFEPKQGGFKVKLPQAPHQLVSNTITDGMDRWEYGANDKASGNSYLIMKKTVNNFSFLDEDTFDLKLVNESFKTSDFIKEPAQKTLNGVNPYPSFETAATLKDGSFAKVKIIVKGPHYYLLAARGKSANADFSSFFSSFELTPFKYEAPKLVTDTFLHFTVLTPVVPELEENFRALIESIAGNNYYNGADRDSYFPKEKNASFRSEKTGEVIMVTMQQLPKYFQMQDGVNFVKEEIKDYLHDDDMILKSFDSSVIDNQTIAYRFTISDTNTSRVIYRMLVNSGNKFYRIAAMGDSSGRQSDFVKTFFSSFRPQKDSSGFNIYASKTDQFFNDLINSDSATHAMAMTAFPSIYFSKKDVPKFEKLLNNLKYGDKDYFDIKVNSIRELGYIKDDGPKQEVTRLLKQIYEKTADTATFTNAVIKSLAKNKTEASYKLLKELMMADPPLFENSYDYANFFANLNDSLLLAKKLFPEILHLLSIDDYKEEVTSMLVTLVDSNLLTAKDYKNFYTNIYFDAKIALKKQQAKDENLMKKESKKNEEDYNGDDDGDERYDADSRLDQFARLMIPFFDKEPGVQKFFEKLLYSKDQSLQLSTAVLLLKNNQKVPDSIVKTLAQNDRYRASLFKSLCDINMQQKFPASYKTQQLMARSVLAGNGEFDKIDSLESVTSVPADFRGRKGMVYFYKYRVKKEDSWKIAFSGLQPANLSDVDTNDDYTKFSDRKLDYETPVSDQFEKEFKKLEISSHKSGKNFYLKNDYNRFEGD